MDSRMGSLEDDDDLNQRLEQLRLHPTVNIIDKDNIEVNNGGSIGSGTFGVVHRGIYSRRDANGHVIETTDCAVKVIWSNEEIRAFVNEVTQLSRVSHENIVTIYGAHIGKPCYLVMEYAAGGSLYNVLHCKPYIVHVQYSLAHAMSWCLQCIRGIDYLHNMEPKPLVHRDIKPPNLLLVDGMLTLKICDFGTACDLATNMTNCKGSAAWMAPEVFYGVHYTEKCDIFSWGIILWEVLSRKKPYEQMNTAYQIMWAIKENIRPPMIHDAPWVLQDLIQQCWHADADRRPTSSEVVKKMTQLSSYCDPNDLVPLRCPIPLKSSSTSSTISVGTSNNSTPNEKTPVVTLRRPNTFLTEGFPSLPANYNNFVSTDPNTPSTSRQGTPEQQQQEQSDALPVHRTHRRQLSGSIGTNIVVGGGGGVASSAKENPSPTPQAAARLASPQLRKSSWPTTPNAGEPFEDLGIQSHLLVEPKLQPLPPLNDSRESVQIYERHKLTCQWFFRQQKEIELLMEVKKELDRLINEASSENSRKVDIQLKYQELFNEQRGLIQMKDQLKRQLRQLQQHGSDDSWVLV